jgi:hypothetical protein
MPVPDISGTGESVCARVSSRGLDCREHDRALALDRRLEHVVGPRLVPLGAWTLHDRQPVGGIHHPRIGTEIEVKEACAALHLLLPYLKHADDLLAGVVDGVLCVHVDVDHAAAYRETELDVVELLASYLELMMRHEPLDRDAERDSAAFPEAFAVDNLARGAPRRFRNFCCCLQFFTLRNSLMNSRFIGSMK